jgi:hypothetical protein
MLTYRYLPVSWRLCIPLNVNPKIPNPPCKKVRNVGSKIVGMVYGSALDAGHIRRNEEVMQEAFDLGKKLVCEDE